MENNQTTVARINNVNILLIQDGNSPVPIKPICQALGIDEEAQRQKINDDEDLNSVALLSKATGTDGKEYPMFCLPLQYIFGWLFTINPKNVKPEAKELVKKYRRQCYDVLYKHFSQYSDYIQEKANMVEEAVVEFRESQDEFKGAKSKMYASRDKMDEARKMTYEDWKKSRNQTALEFPETGNNEEPAE